MRSAQNGTGIRGSRLSRTLWVVVAVMLALGLLLTMAGTGLAARQRVRAGHNSWRPDHLFITGGDTLVWRNPDDRRHNIVAFGGGWRFNRTLDPGESARRVFDEVPADGDPFLYRCTLHSTIDDGLCHGMCGLIHVFAD